MLRMVVKRWRIVSRCYSQPEGLWMTCPIVVQTVVYFVCSMVGSGFQSYPKDMGGEGCVDYINNKFISTLVEI